MIDKDSIEKLKQIIDIREVISSYLDLRKAGMNYMASCPFHDEKTPSFIAVSYTHLTLPTIQRSCRSRWSPYH